MFKLGCSFLSLAKISPFSFKRVLAIYCLILLSAKAVTHTKVHR